MSDKIFCRSMAGKIANAMVVLSFLAGCPVALATTVNSVAQLVTAVNEANSGGDRTILIAAGKSPYLLNGTFFRLTADGITVAGATGNRSEVVLDGEYDTTEIFQVTGSNVTIRDMTLKRAYYHPIHVFPENGDVVSTRIENVHIIDPGQQAIKINQNAARTYSARNGLITGSRIELTDAGRAKVWEINGSCYTGGVDGHHALDWTVRGNVISGFWCAGGLSEHGVHFWSDSENSVVERNLIINCDRGIGFGLGSSGHTGGIIRNNMIYHDTGHTYADVGIGLESAAGVNVYNNTIFHRQPYLYAIEYRFTATSGGGIYNNLTNKQIVSRDGGTASVAGNVTTAQATWFRDADGYDLHLGYRVPGVVDSGRAVSGLLNDFDGETRAGNGAVDIGADELMQAHAGGRALPWLHLLKE